jgi:3-oxoacyl-[acyl-carrier-protein] synthase II
MAATSRRTVITGIGVLNAIGTDPAAFWQALQAGKSGISTIRTFDPSGLPVRIAAEVRDFDPKSALAKEQRKNLRMMARTIHLAVAAAQKALDHGAVDKSKLDKTRFGVEFGSGLIASELPELIDAARASTNGSHPGVDLHKWGEKAIPTIPPLWMLKYLPNMLACHVSILHDAQGPNNSITESEVASLLAMGEAHRILQRDQADFFLVGGAESKINPLSVVRQCLFEPLSHRNDAPQKACRPFDRDHDGAVVGEGGCVFCFEDLEHARKRGATIYAEVAGFGAAFDTRRTGAGLARAIRAALTDANVQPEDIDHVNAHATGAPEIDRWEARGIAEVFGPNRVPVLAAKGYFGHMGAGGSLTELAASVLGLHHGLTPMTLNYESPDPECPVHVIAREPRSVRRPYVLKSAFTSSGQCAALVIKRKDEG